jgi:ubiquinone biosynthesis protein UbiJ
MAETSFDPVAAWQKFISDWEKQVNEASAQMTGTAEFSRAMNQITKFSMAAQQQFDKQMEQALKTVHLPSKSEIAGIIDRLAALEDAVYRLTAMLERDEQRGNSPPAKIQITRTRRPPAISA